MNAINWPVRTLSFASFVLTEYLRSWRYLVELLAGVTLMALFAAPVPGAFNLPQFLTVAGLFMLVQAAYTTWVVVGLGRRPQGYVVLARPLGRSGYLLGHYLASMAMTTIVYVGLTLVALLLHWLENRALGLLFEEWWSGTLPLLMNAAVVSAFITLISPLVLTPWPRLAALTLLFVAISSEIKLLDRLDMGWAVVRLHELSGLLILPLAAGFRLALQGGYTSGSIWILAHQLLLALALLSLALFAFKRRELILAA